jgi:hypothetical protein
VAVALDSHFRGTVAGKCLHDRNVKAGIEEQMNGGMAQVVEAERSHMRDDDLVPRGPDDALAPPAQLVQPGVLAGTLERDLPTGARWAGSLLHRAHLRNERLDDGRRLAERGEHSVSVAVPCGERLLGQSLEDLPSLRAECAGPPQAGQEGI